MARSGSSSGKSGAKRSAGKRNAKDKKTRHSANSRNPIKIQQALYEIADAASAVTDMQSFYKRMHEIVGTMMYAENFFIALYDPQTDLIAWPYYVDTVDVEHPEPIALKNQHGGTGWILRTGRTLSHADGTVSYAIEHGEAEQTGTVSDAIGVPLRSDGKTVGVLLIQSYRNKFKYNLKHVKIMDFVAKHISIALTRARAIEETRQRNAELQIINSVQEGLASKLEMQGIYDLVGDKVRDLFDANAVTLATFELDKNILRLHYAIEKGRRNFIEPIPIPEIYINFIRRGQPLLINNKMAEYIEEVDPGFKQLAGEMPKSVLAVPLTMKGQLFGLITLQNMDRENAFSESDMPLLQTLANSMSVALENARLFDETRQRNAELAILNSVGEAMAKTLDVKTVTKIVGDKVRDIFGADQVGILLLERQTNLLHLLYGYDKTHDRYLDDGQVKPIPLGKGLTSRVIESRQPLLFGTQEEKKGYGHYMPPELVGQIKVCESWLGVPIMVADNVLGAALVEDYRPHAYNESHLRLLQTLSSSMGVAIQNARLFDETQRLLQETEDRAAELAVINSVQEGLASKLEMQAIYDLVGDKVMEIFEADVVGIGFYDPALKALDHPYIVDHGERFFPPPMPVPDEMVEYLKTHDATLINTYQEAQALMERFGIHNIGGPTPDNSYIVVPLTIGGEFMGRITVAKLPAYAFTESDVRLMQTLVNSMSVALENARLWEQEKLYRRALQRELEIGREIQAGFLPEALPQIEGWEIAASLTSAREVAGDFYDVFELPDGNIGLVIADVCDKGVGAALFMTLFRSLIRAVSNLDYFEHTGLDTISHSPAERLQRAMSLTNNYIAETHEKSGMFATLFFGILDPRNGRLAYINGGHEPPLIVREGFVRETLSKTGSAVGLTTDGCFELRETTLQPGEIFLAYTDGVPDCQSPRGDFYGRDNLLALLRESSASSRDLINAIEADLHRYAADATQFDDITLLAVRRG